MSSYRRRSPCRRQSVSTACEITPVEDRSHRRKGSEINRTSYSHVPDACSGSGTLATGLRQCSILVGIAAYLVVRRIPSVLSATPWLIIIIIKFFNKKFVKRNFTNGEENGVQIIVNNNVYTKLLSKKIKLSYQHLTWYTYTPWRDLSTTLRSKGQGQLRKLLRVRGY